MDKSFQMIFAPDTKRTEEGWIDFPNDRKLRDLLWPDNFVDHPAKYSCHLVLAITEYLTSPGDTILDPMSGTGTSMIAAIKGRNVICIELIEKYHRMQQEVVAKLETMSGLGSTMILHGDCLKFLPIQADLLMFSPPYPAVTMGKYNAARDRGEDFSDYTDDPFSSANCSEFLYWHRMERLYKAMLPCAPLMAYTIRDSIRAGRRTDYTGDSIRLCESVGWTFKENILIKAHATAFTAVRKSRDLEIIPDESILIFAR